jgi:hypothetical protein
MMTDRELRQEEERKQMIPFELKIRFQVSFDFSDCC